MASPIRPIPADNGVDPAKAALGRMLFHDTRLSKDDSVSCASCHELSAGGGDGRRVSVGINNTPGLVNSPTVFNAGFNFKQFRDGRAESLADQIDGPVQSSIEMGSLWPEVVAKLFQDERYPQLFGTIYPDGINRANVKDALAEFMTSLTTPNSRFDRWLNGESNAISPLEKRGYTMFKYYGCVSCHQGANVGGSLLYWLVRNNDPEGYRTSISGVQRIQQLAADWSIGTARVRSDPLADFDSLVAFIPQMSQLKGALLAKVRSLPDIPDRLANDVSAYVSAVDAKEERIERFKTGYAVIRNSSRYLPLAAANIVQAPNINPELLGEVSTLTNEIDAYLVAPTDATKGRLTVALERLGASATVLPAPLPNYLANFISHADVLLERQAPTDELFSLTTSSEISDLAVKIVDDLGFELDRKQERNDQYLNGILVAVAALLLLWIVFAVSRTRTTVAEATVTTQRVAVAGEPATDASEPAAGAEKPTDEAVSRNAKLLMSHKILSDTVGQRLAVTADEIATGMESLSEANDKVQETQSSAERADVVAAANAVVANVRAQATEIAEVAERLSAFSKRQGEVSYSLLDLNDCIDEVVAVTQAENVATVETDCGDVPDIFASRTEICLMLEKVVENSAQAIHEKGQDDKGEIRIATKGEKGKAYITIIDNGVGMSAAVRESMFEPFYAATDGRTSVGLTSTSYLVEKYGGSISVSSMPGGGTVTRITLPGTPE